MPDLFDQDHPKRVEYGLVDEGTTYRIFPVEIDGEVHTYQVFELLEPDGERKLLGSITAERDDVEAIRAESNFFLVKYRRQRHLTAQIDDRIPFAEKAFDWNALGLEFITTPVPQILQLFTEEVE